jgi:hypothetical protein
MTTPIDLAALEALCNAATPGPWQMLTDDLLNGELIKWIATVEDDGTNGATVLCDGDVERNNLLFIAASRTALPALIAELRSARVYIALLESATGTMIQVERERRTKAPQP